MKNYDELTNDLLERRDRYVADQKRTFRKGVSQWITVQVATAVSLMVMTKA